MKAISTTEQVQRPRAEGQTERPEQWIQKRAYDLYLKRGRTPGHELEDWLQAERELRERRGNQKAA